MRRAEFAVLSEINVFQEYNNSNVQRNIYVIYVIYVGGRTGPKTFLHKKGVNSIKRSDKSLLFGSFDHFSRPSNNLPNFIPFSKYTSPVYIHHRLPFDVMFSLRIAGILTRYFQEAAAS